MCVYVANMGFGSIKTNSFNDSGHLSRHIACVAVLLSPLNKREVLNTTYILIWSVAVVISAPR